MLREDFKEYSIADIRKALRCDTCEGTGEMCKDHEKDHMIEGSVGCWVCGDGVKGSKGSGLRVNTYADAFRNLTEIQIQKS